MRRAQRLKERVDIVEYPDSNKVGAFVGDYSAMDLSAMFKADSTVGYNEGE